MTRVKFLPQRLSSRASVQLQFPAENLYKAGCPARESQMEFVLSGNQVKTLTRAIICMSKVGNELLVDAHADKLTFRTLNSSRSSFLSIRFKPQFFDAYSLTEAVLQCSVLLKSVCTVFRTPSGSIDSLAIILPTQEADKLQWTLECCNGMRKTYWIPCTSEDGMQDVVVPRESLSSHLVGRPRDLGRLLSNFQSTLSEITLIATEPVSSMNASEAPEAKAVALISYCDTVKDGTDDTLHTQLWIDPLEELQEYSHFGDAVDVTFSVKELKAFLAFCEGSEADLHLFFEKAGHPIIVAPRFGLDDAAHADFDATLVLATVQGSQLRQSDSLAEDQPANAYQRDVGRNSSASPADGRNKDSRGSTPASARGSDHTVIRSEVTGSGGRATRVTDWSALDGIGPRIEYSERDHNLDASEEIAFSQHKEQSNGDTSLEARLLPQQFPAVGAAPGSQNISARMQNFEDDRDRVEQPTAEFPLNAYPRRNNESVLADGAPQVTRPCFEGITLPAAQAHRASSPPNIRNWVDGDLDDDSDSKEEYGVESTPPHRREIP